MTTTIRGSTKSPPMLNAIAGDVIPGGDSRFNRIMVGTFVGAPMVALAASIPLAIWVGFLGWHDFVIGIVGFCITVGGVGSGFHRYFTHKSFKARWPLKVALGVAGSLAIEGRLLDWVADHRRHHKYSDEDGDPHSPWRFGTDWKALAKGLAYAHIGWLFDHEPTVQSKFIGDWNRDRTVRAISRLFPLFVVISLLAPPAIGYWWSGSWYGALTGFFWGTLIRMASMHHVTWSINSICHTFGKRVYESRDQSRNVPWLAILSFGESWHNLHHADPSCARHGASRGQIDINARFIWACERLGLAYDVKWPNATYQAGKRIKSQAV